ncbi:MAG: ATP-binding protein [Chitinophagaceae bacterium]|jgi:predicted AAA+ superfamily ATPase|nr:ATP-binding protein [Chitinophagaceae bacterium]
MERNLLKTLKSHLNKKEFTILTGARQTGKSTLLRQLENNCKEKNTPTVFLNLENKNVLSELNKSPLNVLNFLPQTDKRVVVFIDEIQYLDDPSHFLKLLYDEQVKKIKIVATGSSAFYIDETFKDSLAGRKRLFHLYTCSFDEYLKLKNKEDLGNEIQRIRTNPSAKSLQTEFLQQEWNSYMIYGGYPAVITEPDVKEKVAYLKEIRDSFVKRDILESGVQNENAFYHLFRILAGQTGNLVNINELSGSLKIKNETINNYLYVLQKCFHIALIKPFFRNLRKELTKMPKIYLLDTGLRNCLINNFEMPAFRLDKGALWENMYFRQLVEKYDVNDIFFWREANGNEVDFVLSHIEQPHAIEVKFDKHSIKESKYKMFRNAYPDIPLQFAWIEPFDEDFFRREMDN